MKVTVYLRECERKLYEDVLRTSPYPISAIFVAALKHRNKLDAEIRQQVIDACISRGGARRGKKFAEAV